MKWFRLYSEFFTDPKLKTFTKCQRHDVLALMSLASESKERGVILIDDEDLAATLELSEEDFAALIAKTERKGITERCQNGRICFVNFLDRQYDNPSDRPQAVAERKGRMKERAQNTVATPPTATERPKNDKGTTDERQTNDTYSDTEAEVYADSEADSRKEKDANANALSAAPPPVSSKRKLSKEEDDNAGQEAMTFFQAGYFGVHGTRYEPADGDTLALKRLRVNLKRGRFEEVVTRFLSCRNDFVLNRRAHAIGLLCRELNAFTSDEAMERAYPEQTALSRGRASPRLEPGQSANSAVANEFLNHLRSVGVRE